MHCPFEKLHSEAGSIVRDPREGRMHFSPSAMQAAPALYYEESHSHAQSTMVEDLFRLLHMQSPKQQFSK
jgi:hypothetical protein